MKPSRHQIAAGVTVVALGALATAALASGDAPTTQPSTAQSAPEVRTQIVRETVHRRAKRSASSHSGQSSSASRGRSSASPSPSRSAAPATAPVAQVSSPDHQRRGRGTDDVGVDDHGGHGGHRDDDEADDHGGEDRSGHGGGGHDD